MHRFGNVRAEAHSDEKRGPRNQHSHSHGEQDDAIEGPFGLQILDEQINELACGHCV
jgi:hypothetical protein